VGGGGGGVGEGKSQIWQVKQFSHFPQLAQEQLRELPAPPVQTQNGGFSVKQDGAAANLTGLGLGLGLEVVPTLAPSIIP
jgi:hypothetical protein